MRTEASGECQRAIDSLRNGSESRAEILYRFQALVAPLSVPSSVAGLKCCETGRVRRRRASSDVKYSCGLSRWYTLMDTRSGSTFSPKYTELLSCK